MKRRRRIPAPEPTPFDPAPGTVHEVRMGRVLPRMFTVQFVRKTSNGWYYDVYDPHHKLSSMVKRSEYGTLICLRCRTADQCLHAYAARKAHKQLWWE